jgi:predicted nucleotidyltransferase
MSILTPLRAAAILAIDAAPDGLSMSQIAASIEASLSSVQRALGDLVETGAVTLAAHRYRPSPSYPWRSLAAIARQEVAPERASDIGRRAAASGSRIPAASRARLADLPVTATVRAALALAIERIVEGVHPKRIILFGSQARGEAAADSDVDLLVVEDAITDRQAATVEIIRLLRGIGMAKDVIVTTPDLLAAASPRAVSATAAREGTTLYERG